MWSPILPLEQAQFDQEAAEGPSHTTVRFHSSFEGPAPTPAPSPELTGEPEDEETLLADALAEPPITQLTETMQGALRPPALNRPTYQTAQLAAAVSTGPPPPPELTGGQIHVPANIEFPVDSELFTDAA